MSKLKITRGSTFADTLQWATDECRLVTATLNPNAPATLTATAHGIPDEWIVSVEGHPRISESDTFRIKVIDANTLSIPCLNASGFGTARSVVLRFNAPVDLSGYSARMQIRDKVGGTVLLELTSAAGDITIDNAAKTIGRVIEAADTAAITWRKGVYDLEMIQGDYVIKIDSGTVEVSDEVTA